jgi:TusA-related sulfurtransferase
MKNLAGKADIIIDFRGSISSISLLKTTQIFEKMKPLEIMEIRVADMDTRHDLLKVLPEKSYVVLPAEATEEDGSYHQVRIQKRP